MLAGRSILVTGGTGSFGRAFIAKILEFHQPRKVIVFSRDEWKQWEMRQLLPDSRLRWFLGDVRDLERLHDAFRTVDLVVHAAALKQVPALEYNPDEAVKTNVTGARNIIHAALDRGVSQVVALSTDKACNPVNLYGASKLVAEKTFQAANALSGGPVPKFSAVRYGNVAGSRGSVIPLWRQAIARQDPLQVTDARMTRFWITLDEAVDLVLYALEHMQGGEVFVPKLPAFKLLDLAAAMNHGAACHFVGIRPGEKLHESLISEDEAAEDHGTCYVLGKSRELKDFSYRSDTALPHLTVTDLQDRLRHIP